MTGYETENARSPKDPSKSPGPAPGPGCDLQRHFISLVQKLGRRTRRATDHKLPSLCLPESLKNERIC